MKNSKVDNKKIVKAAKPRCVSSLQVRTTAKSGIKMRSGLRAGYLMGFTDIYWLRRKFDHPGITTTGAEADFVPFPRYVFKLSNDTAISCE